MDEVEKILHWNPEDTDTDGDNVPDNHDVLPTDRFTIDSAGTHAYHVGQPPDNRAQAAARRRGVEIGALRARQVTSADFLEFRLLLAMDQANLEVLRELAPRGLEARAPLALEFAPHLNRVEVPDPYYGSGQGFEQVFNLLEHAADGLLAWLELNPVRD